MINCYKNEYLIHAIKVLHLASRIITTSNWFGLVLYIYMRAHVYLWSLVEPEAGRADHVSQPVQVTRE